MPTLPFGNVAATLVDLATEPKWSGKRVLITTDGSWS